MGGPVEPTCLTLVRGSFHPRVRLIPLGSRPMTYNPLGPNEEAALSVVLPVLCASQEGFTQTRPVCVYQCPTSHSAYQMIRNTRQPLLELQRESWSSPWWRQKVSAVSQLLCVGNGTDLCPPWWVSLLRGFLPGPQKQAFPRSRNNRSG